MFCSVFCIYVQLVMYLLYPGCNRLLFCNLYLIFYRFIYSNTYTDFSWRWVKLKSEMEVSIRLDVGLSELCFQPTREIIFLHKCIIL